jgi:hypothetical protein
MRKSDLADYRPSHAVRNLALAVLALLGANVAIALATLAAI